MSKRIALYILILFLNLHISYARSMSDSICLRSPAIRDCSGSAKWCVKTNMLYDALAVPNIGVEFYLGKGMSVSGEWMYAWWKTDRRHRYWRIYGGDVALRWWFGSRSRVQYLTGHHLGIYAGMFTYDVLWGNKGYMGGEPGESIWDRMNGSSGIEYGYSLPISHCLNIDFNLAVGYMWGRYHEYTPDDSHYVWLSTRNRRWFGPTRLEVSLVWFIGDKCKNRCKGGER